MGNQDEDGGSYFWRTPEGDFVPDTDRILRELIQAYMIRSGVSLEWVADRSQHSAREIRAFLKGKPASLRLATTMAALRGITIDELFSNHPQYLTTSSDPELQKNKIMSLKDRFLQLLGRLLTTKEVRDMYNWAQIVREFPELGPIAEAGKAMTLEIAKQKGHDAVRVSHEAEKAFLGMEEHIERVTELKRERG